VTSSGARWARADRVGVDMEEVIGALIYFAFIGLVCWAIT
jgi:hypothetical protein